MADRMTLAKRVFETHLEKLRRHVQRNGVRGLEQLYKEAKADLTERLLRVGPADQRATPTQMRAMLAQLDAVLSEWGKRLEGHLRDTGQAAVEMGAKHGVDEFRRLSKIFEGTVPVVDVDVPARFRGLVKDVDSSLLRRHRLQSRTWTTSAIADMERMLSNGVMTGKGTSELVKDLTGIDGMDGLRWKAERIVRTELSHAHNSGKFESMRETQEELGEPLFKRLIATFDDRTGDDSLLLHGQAVPIDQPFEWKHKVRGRWVVTKYMHPPNRPNDREVVVPWDPKWDAQKHEQPLTKSRLRAENVEIPPGHVPGKPYTASARRAAKRK